MKAEAKVDRRILKTKAAINKAFLELFSERGLEQITINEIAERANVNRGTVYLHYTDKFDLLDKCIEEHIHKLVTFCSQHELHLDRSSLIEALLPVFLFFEENFPFFSTLFVSQRTFLFRERLLAFVSSSLQAKYDKTKMDPLLDAEINAQFMASSFVGIIEWWIMHHMPHPPAFMAEQLCRLFEKNNVEM